jgi:hypothetical protein
MHEHPANHFRNLRAKYIAIARKHGFKTAFYILEKEKDESKFDLKGYTGLMCELVFLEAHGNDLDLDATLDAGEHCDFRGSYNNVQARFDVTSSLAYKDLEDYSPFQKQGRPYYIALVDANSRKVDRIIDINFPFCVQCGCRLVNVALIGDVQQTEQGTPTQSHRLIQVCSNDISHNITFGEYEYFLPTIPDEIESLHHLHGEALDSGNMNSSVFKNMVKKLPEKHGIDNSLFFSKLSGDKIHACGHDKFTATDNEGDGDWSTELYWMTDMVDTLLPKEFNDAL